MLKRIRIEDELHRRAKAAAALAGVSIKEWVEHVLEDALDGAPSASVLIDQRGEYKTQEADNA